MRARVLTLSFAVIAAATVALAGNPDAAIGAARQALNERHYDRAVQLLGEAAPEADRFLEPKRSQALAAIHFYSALAFHGLGNDEKSREKLEQFFQFSNMNTIDAGKFDAGFVKLFQEVRSGVQHGESASFALAYPKYATFTPAPGDRPIAQWGDGPELTLFGTAAERAEWRTLQDDDARRSFIEKFWSQRDKTSGTAGNEFRREMTRRIAFADETFLTERQRGSMTDRGQVFVLLGPPSIVRHLPLTATVVGRQRGTASTAGAGSESSANTWQSMDRANRSMGSTKIAEKGKIERWVYGRDQLVKPIPDDQIAFTFVTDEGYGENVLEREPMVNKALAEARTQQ